MYVFPTWKPDNLEKKKKRLIIKFQYPQAVPLVVRPKIINAAIALLEFPI